MHDIVCFIVDGEINTKDQAAALVAKEAEEMAQVYDLTVEEARKRLLANIGYVTGYFDHATADKVFEIFETEHPIFGKTHPSAEDAYRMGMEHYEALKKKKEADDGAV
jgi:glutamate synthase domain-containing protein 3